MTNTSNTSNASNALDTIIDDAINKKYTDFSTAIHQALQNKLNNNSKIQDKISEFDRLQSLKAAFKAISQDATNISNT